MLRCSIVYKAQHWEGSADISKFFAKIVVIVVLYPNR